MASVIADLMVNLIGNDAQLVDATRAAGVAMEELAKQGVSMSTNLKFAFTEAGAQATGMTVKIQEAAEGSTRAMGSMTRSMQTQLQQLNLTMKEMVSPDFTRGTADQLAQMSRQAQAAISLAKQQASEETAAAREAAAEKLAIEREVDEQIRLENERTMIAYRQEIADRMMLDREAAAAAREAAAQQAAAQRAAVEGNEASMARWKSALGLFGELGKAGIDLGEKAVKIGTAFTGAGSAATGALGPIGIAAGIAGSTIEHAFGVATEVLGAFVDAAEKVSLGIAAIGTAALIASSKFDQLMLRTVTMAQAPLQGATDGLEHMKQAVLDLSSEVGKTPDEMAKALYHIESLGYRGADALELLKRAGQEAAMSGANLEDVATAMGAIARVGFKDVATGAQQAADAASYLNTITGIGNMTMQDLTSAIGTGILPVLKEAGLGMRDFGAAIALATDNAEPANQAATKLRQTIAMIETAALQTKKVDAFSSIGMQADQMAKDLTKHDGLLVAVNDLRDHLTKAFGPDALNQLKTYNQIMDSDGQQAADDWASHMSKAAQVVDQIFGGARSGGFINMLLDQTNQLAKGYSKIGDEQERNARFAQSWALQQQQLSQLWEDFKAKVEAVFVTLGNKLQPTVKALIGDFKEFYDKIKSAFDKSPIKEEFLNALKYLKDQLLPVVKEKLDDLANWFIQHKDDIEGFSHWVVDKAIPAVEKFTKETLPKLMAALEEVKGDIKSVTDTVKDNKDGFKAWGDLIENVVLPIIGGNLLQDLYVLTIAINSSMIAWSAWGQVLDLTMRQAKMVVEGAVLAMDASWSLFVTIALRAIQVIIDKMDDFLQKIDHVAQHIPGLPKAWKDGLDGMANEFHSFRGSLDRDINALDGRVIHIGVQTQHNDIYTTTYYSNGTQQMGNSRYGPNGRYGAITAFADGGMAAGIYQTLSGPGIFKFAEPQTGGEAYIPRNVDHARAMQLASIVGKWHGFSVVPNGFRTATGGMGGASNGSNGGGVQLVEAHVFLDGRELYQSTIQLAQRYKHRNGSTGVT